MGDKRKFICPEEEGTATDRRPPKIVEYVLQAKDRCPGGELKKPTLFLLHGHRINCEVGSCKTLATYCLQHPFQGCDPEVRLHEWFPGVKDDMPAVIHEGASILLEKKSAQKHSLLTGAYLQHLGDCTVDTSPLSTSMLTARLRVIGLTSNSVQNWDSEGSWSPSR